MIGESIPVKITNQKIKPPRNSAIVVSQSTKDGEFAEIYDPVSVLADGDPVEIHGALTEAGMILSAYAEAGTAFHEAFHVVERLYLNARQRKRLYDEVRKEKGKSHYTDEQASEVLAERYRKIALKNQSVVVNKSDNIVVRALKSIRRFVGYFMYLDRARLYSLTSGLYLTL